MSANLDLEPLLDHIEHSVMPEWVVQKDRKKELLAEGKPFDSPVVEDLDAILELFYEKEYRKGLETYIDWLLKEGPPMYYKDIEMLVRYSEHFGIGSFKINKLCANYKKPEE